MRDNDSEIRLLQERVKARKEGTDYLTHLENRLLYTQNKLAGFRKDVKGVVENLNESIGERRASESNAQGIRTELSEILAKYPRQSDTD